MPDGETRDEASRIHVATRASQPRHRSHGIAATLRSHAALTAASSRALTIWDAKQITLRGLARYFFGFCSGMMSVMPGLMFVLPPSWL